MHATSAWTVHDTSCPAPRERSATAFQFRMVRRTAALFRRLHQAQALLQQSLISKSTVTWRRFSLPEVPIRYFRYTPATSRMNLLILGDQHFGQDPSTGVSSVTTSSRFHSRAGRPPLSPPAHGNVPVGQHCGTLRLVLRRSNLDSFTHHPAPRSVP